MVHDCRLVVDMQFRSARGYDSHAWLCWYDYQNVDLISKFTSSIYGQSRRCYSPRTRHTHQSIPAIQLGRRLVHSIVFLTETICHLSLIQHLYCWKNHLTKWRKNRSTTITHPQTLADQTQELFFAFGEVLTFEMEILQFQSQFQRLQMHCQQRVGISSRSTCLICNKPKLLEPQMEHTVRALALPPLRNARNCGCLQSFHPGFFLLLPNALSAILFASFAISSEDFESTASRSMVGRLPAACFGNSMPVISASVIRFSR